MDKVIPSTAGMLAACSTMRHSSTSSSSSSNRALSLPLAILLAQRWLNQQGSKWYLVSHGRDFLPLAWELCQTLPQWDQQLVTAHNVSSSSSSTYNSLRIPVHIFRDRIWQDGITRLGILLHLYMDRKQHSQPRLLLLLLLLVMVLRRLPQTPGNSNPRNNR